MKPHVTGIAAIALTIAAECARAGLPLAFERNAGQADSGVEYVARGPGYGILFATDGATLVADGGTVRMSWRGANRRPYIHGRGAATGSASYMSGPREAWRTGIPLYSGVRYDDLYPGIDLVFYGSEGRLEYDFILRPGADPAVIAICFGGIEDLRLDGGELVLRTGGGELRHRRPRIYQEGPGGKEEVAGEYVLLGAREAGFRVPAYDRGRALVIDPVLAYSTYLGGSGDDRAWAIAVDASGCAYVAGETWSANFPRTVQPGAARGNQEAFVAKLNAAGTGIVYATYFGGRSRDTARAIALDSAGNAYIAGFTYSPDFPTTAGAMRTTAAGQEDAFVVKLNAAGTAFVYSTILGGAGSDFATGIAVDAGGSVYVSGYTSSVAFPVTVAAVQKTFRGGFQDAFAAKLNATGTGLVYATYIGGSANDVANGIAVDAGGFAYLAGYTDSADFPVRNALQATPAGQGDAFVVKVNPGGEAFAYATYFGGSGRDTGNAVAVDSAGNTYIAGATLSRDLPVTAGASQTNTGGNYDAFVTKLNSSGSAVAYATYAGGSDTDEATSLTVDGGGIVNVAGSTRSLNFPLFQAGQGNLGGRVDAFLFTLSESGSAMLYATYLGGAGDDNAAGIAWNGNARAAYITGTTTSGNFPVSSGAYRAGAAGSVDLFVAKITMSGIDGGSSTPAGTGTAADLVFSVSDPNGAANVDTIYVLIGSTLTGPNACYLVFNATSRQIWLASDQATTWIVGPPVGQAGSVQNSQCMINVGDSSASLSGNTVTLRLIVHFSPVFAGSRNIYLLARNRMSQQIGWVQVGTWVVPGSNPPTVSVSPAAGSGSSATLSFVVSDAGGAADVDALYILIGSSLSGPNACYLAFDVTSRQLWLASNDANSWSAGVRVGEPGVVQNSQCTIDSGASSISLSGNTATLKLNIVFQASFAGAKNVYMLGRDRAMLDTGWRLTGSWTVPGPVQSPTVTVSPKTGSGAIAALNFIASDPNGAADVNAMYILIGSGLSGPNACYLAFDVASRQLWLATDDANSWIVGPPVGNPGKLQNSQCIVDLGASSTVLSGNSATLYLAMTFQPAFAGIRNIYFLARDQAQLQSGWQQVGTWTR